MTTDIKTEETADELKAQFEDQYGRDDVDVVTGAEAPSETCYITSC